MAMRWIPYSRVSMQRAGVLVAVTAAAHDTRATTLEKVARSYSSWIQRDVAVPEAARGDVARYLRQLRLWERYPALRQAESLPADVEIQLQDLWLSDRRLPSATGAITDEVIDDPPQLAESMRLIRASNLTRTDRGRALLRLLREDERRAAGVERANGAPPEGNLFLLSPGVRVFLAYALLDADFDFVQVAYAEPRPKAFKRSDFADRLNSACRTLRQRWARQTRSGSDRQLLARLDEWAKLIDRPRLTGKKWGGGRPPDQLATLRLEPYVDFGLVTRKRRNAYLYELNASQQAFFDELVAAEGPEEFLRNRMCASALVASGHQPQQVDDEEIWTRVRDAYDALKSALGFASFEEVTLLAIGQLLNESDGARYFEVGDGLRVMRERQKSEPRRVRFGIRRGGGLTYLKIVEGAKDG
jgi:hypothetical protein